METDDGDVVVFGEPHRIERIHGTREARWHAMQAVIAAAKTWHSCGYSATYPAEDDLAAALDRLAAVERGETD